MKKWILSSIFILFIIIANGQVILIDKLTKEIVSSGSYSVDQFVYDDLFRLQGIYRSSADADTTLIQEYSNDTLIARIYPLEDKKYIFKYFSDSVVDWHIVEGDTSGPYVYYIDDENRIIGTQNGTVFKWENENMIADMYTNGDVNTMTYFDDILNPHFEQFKYYRWRYRGSHSYIKKIEDYYGLHEFDVTEVINNYPKTVNYYHNSQHLYTYSFEYIEKPNSVEISPDPGNINVLSVHYYNLLGQEIDKPTRGFYIKRKITYKGIISTKYYIP